MVSPTTHISVARRAPATTKTRFATLAAMDIDVLMKSLDTEDPLPLLLYPPTCRDLTSSQLRKIQKA